MKNYNFFALSFFISSYCNAQLKIYSHFPDKHEAFRAEFIAHNLLKNRTCEKDLNFIYMPWSYLYNNLIEGKIPNIKNALFIRTKDAFTICSHDYYEQLIPYFKTMGINVLFVCGANNKKYPDIDVVSMPYFARNQIKSRPNKDIFYSFLGSLTHKCRQQVFTMKHPENCVVVRRERFHYNKHTDKKLMRKHEIEYRDTLSRSRFSLCPRGYASGSYRFWESLQAGAIPVLIADDHLLPIGYNWNKCIIKVKEKDIALIPEILSKITKEDELRMRRNCLHAYSLYSGNNFDRVIRLYYGI